jgi:stage II sporulation protein M
MRNEINWKPVILVIGLTFVLVGVQVVFALYTFFNDDFAYVVSFLANKGIFESFIGILLFLVIVKNTTLEDIRGILRDIRPHIVISAGFLFIGIAVGVLLQGILHGFSQTVFEDLVEQGDMFGSMPPHYQTLFIFGNNSRVAVLSGILAFIPFIGLLLPFSIMFMNGFVIGVAPGIFDIAWSTFAMAILPHGIFEIPALILASAVGLKFAVSSLKAIIGFLSPPYGVAGRDVFYREIRPGWHAVKLFAVIIPLLIIAALVEVLVSQHLA